MKKYSVALCAVSAVLTLHLSTIRGDDSPPVAEKQQILTVGQPLPALESIDESGQPWKLADHVGHKVLVFYFYPGDFTGGCIKQAESFREGLKRLEDLGVEVVGVSGDQVATHQLFRTSHGLKHTLLADPEGKLAAALGVPVTAGTKVRTRGPDGKPLMDERGKSIIVTRPSTLARWTFVVGSNGKILSRREDVDPVKDAEEVLKLVKEGK